MVRTQRLVCAGLLALILIFTAFAVALRPVPQSLAHHCPRPGHPHCTPATPVPTATQTPGPTPPPNPVNGIWFGAFFDQNVRNEAHEMQPMIDDLQAHGLDSLMSVNGFVEFHEVLLNVTDAENFPIFGSHLHGELNAQWWPSSVPATMTEAERVIGPLIDRLKVHPSLMGYNIKDDADPSFNEKMRLAQRVIEAHDPPRVSSPTMTKDLGDQVYPVVLPDVFLMYNYPATESNTACSWATSWVNEIRANTAGRTVPLYLILQTHQTTSGPVGTKLRYPTVNEVRLQAWIALGEEAKGLWWFHYDDIGGEWLGFRNQPATYAELTSLASRVSAIEVTLGPLDKVADAYTSNGYVSTLTAAGKTYVIAANRSCSSASLTINGPGTSLRNVETGTIHAMGSAISFTGGNGALFEVIP